MFLNVSDGKASRLSNELVVRKSCVDWVRQVALIIATLILSSKISLADSIAEANQAPDPPIISNSETSCKAGLFFKPVINNSQHAWVVVTRPGGEKLELRAGPQGGGSGSEIVPGLIVSNAAQQPTGNPFECGAGGPSWGVVTPYVGLHGRLGTDASGRDIYSPDGNVATPTAQFDLGSGAQDNICAMANCMMQMIKALGASCKNYQVGTLPRNSNTVISQALASCGVADPKPINIDAPGWGRSWED